MVFYHYYACFNINNNKHSIDGILSLKNNISNYAEDYNDIKEFLLEKIEKQTSITKKEINNFRIKSLTLV